jgi:hypothetical protein
MFEKLTNYDHYLSDYPLHEILGIDLEAYGSIN